MASRKASDGAFVADASTSTSLTAQQHDTLLRSHLAQTARLLAAIADAPALGGEA